MLTKASLDSIREEKILILKEKYDEDILSYKDKMHLECEEAVKHLKQFDDETPVHFELRKANTRQSYEDKIFEYTLRREKKLNRDIKKLEKKDKAKLSRLNRIWEIDLVRGVIIIGMIVDHLMYDLTFSGLFGGYMFLDTKNIGWLQYVNLFATGYWEGNFRVFLRVLGVVLLVFLCGISSALSKNNIKRGAILFGIGIAMTIGLNIFGKIINNPAFMVVVSTLTMLGFFIMFYNGAKLLYIFIESRFNKKGFKETRKNSSWKWVALVSALSIFAFWFFFRNSGNPEFNLNGRTLLKPYDGYYSYSDIKDVFSNVEEMNPALRNFLNFFLIHNEANPFFNFFLLFNNEGSYCVYRYISFENMTFFDFITIIGGAKGTGVDWLGFFPMVGHIFLGGFIGEILYKDKKSIIYYFFKKEYRNAKDPLTTTPGKINAILNNVTSFITYPGQKTIFVYVFHQPVIFIIGSLILLMLGASISF